MAQEKISMPAASAGITRFFEEYKSRIEFQPTHIIVLAVFIIIVMLILHSIGPSLLGLQ
ncbi:preprotein translocase subunit Sec61beta [Candidatus Woesearchaeota archaeon]|nr:preprotein translocase subunit Sec61beta [Candidatus Woesearchaeota archaeon]